MNFNTNFFLFYLDGTNGIDQFKNEYSTAVGVDTQLLAVNKVQVLPQFDLIHLFLFTYAI